MKINELTKAPLTDFRKRSVVYDRSEPQDEIDQFMRKYGFKPVSKKSRGYFATVLKHSKLDYVLKIFKSQDRGYSGFVDFVLSHNSQHLPRFIGKQMQITPKFKAIRIENLEPISDMVAAGNIRDYFYSLPYPNRWAAELEIGISDSYGKEFVELLKELASFGRERRLPADLGTNNLMIRGDTIVIIDPFG